MPLHHLGNSGHEVNFPTALEVSSLRVPGKWEIALCYLVKVEFKKYIVQLILLHV